MIETIAKRLAAIAGSARCDCSATKADCDRHPYDPLAPFGCCDRCNHSTINPGALTALVKEIESGTVRTVEEVHPPKGEPRMGWIEYLDQSKVWRPNGKPLTPIADMDEEWRFNASRFLDRRAYRIALEYGLEETFVVGGQLAMASENARDGIERAMAQEDEQRTADPIAWIRSTRLHRALVAGLPDCSVELSAVADRAKHWSACPARTGAGDCQCEELRAADLVTPERAPS